MFHAQTAVFVPAFQDLIIDSFKVNIRRHQPGAVVNMAGSRILGHHIQTEAADGACVTGTLHKIAEFRPNMDIQEVILREFHIPVNPKEFHRMRRGEGNVRPHAPQRAKGFTEILNNPNHLILQSAHPSPFSAYNGFFGCKHFSKCNEFLIKNNIQPIDWKI